MVVFSIEFNFEVAVQLQTTKDSFLYSFKQWNRALTLMLYSTATRTSSIFVGRLPLNRRFFSRNRRISRIVLRALY